MDVFDPCLRQFHAEDILAESSFVTPWGFAHIGNDPDARSLQFSDVGVYVHSLIAEGVEVQIELSRTNPRAWVMLCLWNFNKELGTPYSLYRGAALSESDDFVEADVLYQQRPAEHGGRSYARRVF
jgi:hypothetical protein